MRIAAAYPASIKNNMTAACSAKNTGFDSLTSMNAKICLWNMYSGIALFIKTYTPYPEIRIHTECSIIRIRLFFPVMQIIENLALAKRRGQKRGLRPGVTKPEKEEYRALLALKGVRALHS